MKRSSCFRRYKIRSMAEFSTLMTSSNFPNEDRLFARFRHPRVTKNMETRLSAPAMSWRSLQGDKEPRALSVQDDARNRESWP